MKEFIITMSVAAVVASALEVLAPKEWDKYVRLAIGLILLSIILSPVAKLSKSEITLNEASYNVDETVFYDEIAAEMKRNVEKDITERLEDEFGVSATVEVELDIDDDHNITGVRLIRISSWRKPEGMTERLEAIYGCDKIEVR